MAGLTGKQVLKAVAIHLHLNIGISAENVSRILDLRGGLADVHIEVETASGSLAEVPRVTKSSLARWTG